jgi:hypothetical protein
VGNISKGKSPVRPQVREEIVEDLRSLQKCLSKLSAQSGVLQGTCQKIVKQRLHMKPYKVQQLKPADYPRHVAYCQWFLYHE